MNETWALVSWDLDQIEGHVGPFFWQVYNYKLSIIRVKVILLKITSKYKFYKSDEFHPKDPKEWLLLGRIWLCTDRPSSGDSVPAPDSSANAHERCTEF